MLIMKENYFFLWIIYGLLQYGSSEKIAFDTGISLDVVDPDLLGTEKDNVADPVNTGSYLFKAKNDGDTRALTLNILVRDFKSADSLYFRAHPTFLKCIQAAMTKLRNANKQVAVKQGFQTSNDVGGGASDRENYLRSGAGITLQAKQGVTVTLDEIVTAVLQTCPVPMMKLERDIGIEKLADGVHVHMKGADHTSGPTFTGVSGEYDDINSGLDPQKIPDCSNLNTVASGAYYPGGYDDPTKVVGVVDEPVDRTMTVDASRLVQYLGNNIEFSDCTNYAGNALTGPTQRCAQRTMTTRMYNAVKYLQKMVIDNMSGKLEITKAWDDTGANPDSLHSEGRALTVKLKASSSSADMTTLSRYAICAGVDYVAHKGDHLLLAVKKMKGDIANMIQFKSIQLMAVEPPSSKASYYSLPSEFTETEINAKYSLFDSSGREDFKLNDNATVGMFMSQDPDYRYFRLDPRIVECYSSIVDSENKNSDDLIEVEVIRGYISNPEQASLMDVMDDRYETHTLGVALQIRYKNGTVGPDFTPQRLAQKAVEQCSPVFNHTGSDEEAVGIGIYKDSVFVDIRDQFELWVEKDEYIPTGYTLETYTDFMEKRAELANDFRIVDPDDMTEACALAHPPAKQSLTYDYDEPEISKRKRRRKRATADDCIPTYSTPHCSLVAKHLQEEVDEIWTETNRKWIYRNATEVKEALDNCLGICGTCLTGAIYDSKLKHCNNLLHWLPFEMMNDDPDITNFYPRDNLIARGLACNGGEHCLEKAPLFSILMPSIKRLYRPDPTKSVKELIYASEENPTPCPQILDELYASHAKGIVKFWVADETDITSFKHGLQTAMLYNKDVTKVHVYVLNAHSKEVVDGVLQGFTREFATTGCPKYTRETVAEFEVLDPPHHVRRRAASHIHNHKNKLVQDAMNWEMNDLRGP
ncbi:unnamed protein product [Mytilus coruscus]|uniref:Hedgehog N-terminal signalling domain-containing protein n=1 Tax=Mytilus coruscus TaxID=42192 RepID=A0A6J8AT95_MYTCO|nr:unnamed protein product [Mytilus coruscus]